LADVLLTRVDATSNSASYVGVIAGEDAVDAAEARLELDFTGVFDSPIHATNEVGATMESSGLSCTVDRPGDVVRMLTEHRHNQKLERLAADSWADPRLVFATRAGTPLSAGNVRRELDRITAEAELPSVTPNELRHTAPSNLSAAGVPIEQIADVLGHTDTAMLMEVYRHAVRPSIDAAA
jgi:hypothetical protein